MPKAAIPKAIEMYKTQEGKIPFELWFNRLNSVAVDKITTAINRMELGIMSKTKSVGEGVSECRVDFGPGYRVYFGMDGNVLIILLIGGTKSIQEGDIKQAKEYWKDYKKRKKTDTL